MGIINGLFGAVRKRIGPLVGRRVNGRNVLSMAVGRPPSRLSELQRVHQFKFKMAVEFLSKITPLINIGFVLKRQIRFNAAVRCNFSRIIKGTFPLFHIDYPEVIFSVGNLQTPNSPVAESDDQGGIVFSWLADQENEFNRRTDLANFLAYDPDLGKPIIVLKAARRDALGYRLVLPVGFSSSALHCYISMVSADGHKASRNVYLGVFTING